MSEIKKCNISSHSINTISKNMREAISLSSQFAFSLEENEMYRELEILKKQNACCFKVLAEVANIIEIHKYNNPLNFSIIELNAFIEDTLGTCRSMLRKTGIVIEFERSRSDAFVKLDSDRFSSCLLNLLVNSFANVDREEGRVKVSVKLLSDCACVQIIDNGYGMDVAKAASYMSDDEVVSGFSILKKFCEAHEASVIFESAENDGFALSLRIPLCTEVLNLRSPKAVIKNNTFSLANILLSKLDFIEVDGIE